MSYLPTLFALVHGAAGGGGGGGEGRGGHFHAKHFLEWSPSDQSEVIRIQYST